MAKRRPPDPHANREAARYEHPIPSRELIAQTLRDAASPLNYQQLCMTLSLTDPRDTEAFRRRIDAMVRDGQLLCNRNGAYAPPEKLDLIRGCVQAHRDGYGFLIPAEGGEDLYLSAREMEKVFDGDEVLGSISGVDRRGRSEARIVEIVQHNTWQVVGRLQLRGKIASVIPDNPRLRHEILLPFDELQNAKEGQYVMVEITVQPGRRQQPLGKITEVLGDHMAPGMEIEVAIRSWQLPNQWSDAVLSEAQSFKAEPTAADKKGREDLRELPLVTIDGEDAKDFDDAVCCVKRKGGGWTLWVAIADVSHYVKPESALDKEAQQRGNSVYFPGRVVPMLPEALSNGLCSLKPHVDRLCQVCEMTISKQGKMTGYRFFDGLMHSKARLTYTEVAIALDEKHPDNTRVVENRKELMPHLRELYNLYHAFIAARKVRGAIDFDTTETRFEFGEDRKISRIVPVVRNDAHKIIEECMLAANVATALHLSEQKCPSLYRVHEGPSGEKLTHLRQFLGRMSLSLDGGLKPTPLDYQKLLSSISERPDRHIIETMLLRSLSQAVYQPDNRGHFGLNYPAYTHFTSPIRRYPDLLVHRAIRSLNRSANVRKKWYPYDEKDLQAFGETCSMTERRADEATRDVSAWLKCEFLKDRVGEEFDGIVSAVTGFGLFVELQPVFVEGLVHVTGLDQDYYHFDPAAQRLVGERTGRAFRLGDKIRVRLARVDLDERKIDLMLAGVTGAAKRSGEGAGRKSGKKFENKPDKGGHKFGKGKTLRNERSSEFGQGHPSKQKAKKPAIKSIESAPIKKSAKSEGRFSKAIVPPAEKISVRDAIKQGQFERVKKSAGKKPGKRK
jgi:ribonuclease R